MTRGNWLFSPLAGCIRPGALGLLSSSLLLSRAKTTESQGVPGADYATGTCVLPASDLSLGSVTLYCLRVILV